MNDTLDMIIGASIGAYILYVMFAFPIFWIKRRYFYDRQPVKNLNILFTDDFHTYVTSKIDFSISKPQLTDIIKYEHTNFKNKAPTASAVPIEIVTVGSVLIQNGGSKTILANILAKTFAFVTKKQALSLLRCEDAYLRKQYPWWKKLLLL